jgi:flavin-binding protein dodecin
MAEHVSTGVIKVTELVGVSQSSFSDAVRQAVTEASKTIRGINGVEVQNSSAVVRDGQIAEYHVNVKIAFPVERAS